MDSQIQAKVNEWLAFDKNPATRAEIESLRDAGNTEELKRRLIESNSVQLASQGLCAYVLQNVPNATERGVVVGHDHRYNSEKWAQLTAAAFVSKGFKVYLYKGIVHTPLVPYTVSKLNAAAGVMITASHNPKDDNGYKVYWENAVQIISPHDAANVDNLVIDRTEEMTVAYLGYIASLSRTRLASAGKQMLQSSQVYQYLHAWSFSGIIDRANKVFDFKPLEHVKEQQDPNPDFPLLLSLILKKRCIGLGNQDCERIWFVKKPDGTWFVFSGDQLGSCLRVDIEGYKASGRPIEKLAMVASTVSSKLIGAMAAKEGFKFVESLTGFKYIGNAARALEAEGYNVLFGYEEAIGFMLGEEVRDKDGVSATSGKLATDYLEEIYAQYGYFRPTSNSYFICSQSEIVDQIFARLRSYNDPASLSKDKMSQYPKSIGGLTVMDIRDLTTGHGFDSRGHMITFKAKGDGVAIVLTVRTSGTEPKIKYYLEGSGSTREQVTKALARVVDELRDEWMQAKLHNLGIPGA
ncbi:phosphoglucomutase/phosphomannomutase, alpha/beta/alpha domain protein [Rhizoctonia solani]|uniref:Phosphoglucomutase/phosphomannomutase, alpha/beta/alpha domain protein n=1 Tax=Rhizoctonia solani TaxID=456999 RepID=A0A8H8P5W8_9AGAM|nr:phosphoglucomutase/phosphomannomutase, alpha/beta/alpha domain protein [Rhizoctonia solani]QRW25110.1 phosphoglucomutase/phosphomannomutase, alpha/beta/alpha domain protein [Rhizoctonia solani]